MTTISTDDFDYLRRLVLEAGGMVLDPSKQYLVVSRLTPVATEFDLVGIGALCEALRSSTDGRLRTRVVEAMTVNETSFFRDPITWEALRLHIFPELLEARRLRRTLRIWSAASSSGQEPYSIAMLLHQLLGDEITDWRIRILATDLSGEMSERTRDGVFSTHEVARGLPDDLRAKFFAPVDDGWQAKESLRRLVDASVLNLTRPPYTIETGVDLILLRNVLIYFDAEMRTTVLSAIANHLAPDGRLILGAAEGTMGVPPSLDTRPVGGAVVYGRSSVPASAASTPRLVSPPAASETPELDPIEQLRQLRKEIHS